MSSKDFAALYEKHYLRIRNFVISRVGDSPDAEDITQEVFINAFRSMEDFEGRSSVATWIYGIAKNTINNSFRGRWTRMVLREEPLEELIDLSSVSRVEARLMLRRVKIALMGIPAEQRRALMLQCNGASTKEIADILCCSEDAAKHRVYRARKSLKEKL